MAAETKVNEHAALINTTKKSTDTVEIFISYARDDQQACKVLVKHLAMLRHQHLISDWHDGMILPGDDWKSAIYEKLQNAKIVLLLISKNFMSSDFCYANELKYAMERHERGETRIVPIILSPCDLEGAPFMKLQALPTNAKPLTLWGDHDEAWAVVVSQLRVLVEIARESFEKSGENRKVKEENSENNKISTLLYRYSKLNSWLSDLHNFFGAVVGAGGLRRVWRTLITLTFNFDNFIAYILSSADLDVNRNKYIAPPVCMIFCQIILMISVFIIEKFSLGSSFSIHNIPMFFMTTLLGIFYSGLAFKILSVQHRSFGEFLAIGCYVGSSITIPAILFLAFLFMLMILGRLFVQFSAMPIYIAIIALGSVAFILAIPLIIIKGLGRFIGVIRPMRLLFFIITIYLFAIVSLAINQPGSALAIGSYLCQSVSEPNCAEKLAKLSIAIQPKSENLWINRIGILMIRNDLPEARKLAEQAVLIHPSSDYLHYQFAKTLSDIDPNRAVTEFKIALALNPNLQDAVLDIHNIYVTQEQYPELLDHCKNALAAKNSSEAVIFYCNLGAGIALVHLNKFDEALIYLKRVLERQTQTDDHAGRARTLNLMGRAYSGLGDHQQALSYCEQAAAISKQVSDSNNQVIALDNIANALQRLGRPADAIVRYREKASVQLSHSPSETQDAQESLAEAFQLALRHQFWLQATSILSELDSIDSPAFLRLWRHARLSGYQREPAAEVEYSKLASITGELPTTTQAHIRAVANAGQVRARSSWPDCPGIVIIQVMEGSQAARIGLAVGDIILRYQGHCMYEQNDLLLASETSAPNKSVTLDRWQRDRITTLTALGGPLGIVVTSF